MRKIDPEVFDDLFDLAKDVCKHAHVTYGVELTVSEAITSVFVEQRYDEVATVGRLHVLLHDAEEMQEWLKKMAIKPVPSRREHHKRVAMRVILCLIIMFMIFGMLQVVSLGGGMAFVGILCMGVLGAAIGWMAWEVLFDR